MRGRLNTIEDFWNNVEKTDNCWNYLLYKSKKGYGQFSWKGKLVNAHKFSYELINSKVPDGMTLDHLCRNRKCVNPKHLEIVTRTENVMRGEGVCAKNKRKTHCKRGHKLSGSNLRLDKDGRHCRTCEKMWRDTYA